MSPQLLPELSVRGGRAAFAFHERAFGATVVDPFGHVWEVGRPRGPWPPLA